MAKAVALVVVLVDSEQLAASRLGGSMLDKTSVTKDSTILRDVRYSKCARC